MWILFALTSAIMLASRKIQEKQLVWKIWNSMGWMLRVGSFLFALLIWILFSRNLDGIYAVEVWYVLLYCVFAYPLLVYLYYRAMHDLPFSLFGMMAPVVPVTALLVSWILFHQVPSLFGFVGIGAISIWVVALFWKHEDKKIKLQSLIFAVLSYMIMGLGWALDKVALMHVRPELYTVLNQWVALVSLFLFTHFYFHAARVDFYKKNFWLLSFIGIIQGIGYLGVMTAISLAPNPGYVVALSNTHAIIVALYGVFILKEEVTPRKVFVFICMLVALISFAFA